MVVWARWDPFGLYLHEAFSKERTEDAFKFALKVINEYDRKDFSLIVSKIPSSIPSQENARIRSFSIRTEIALKT